MQESEGLTVLIAVIILLLLMYFVYGKGQKNMLASVFKVRKNNILRMLSTMKKLLNDVDSDPNSAINYRDVQAQTAAQESMKTVLKSFIPAINKIYNIVENKTYLVHFIHKIKIEKDTHREMTASIVSVKQSSVEVINELKSKYDIIIIQSIRRVE